MLKEDLIKELEKYPDGTEVVIADWRKNLHHDSGDGSSEGLVKDFKVGFADKDDVKEGTLTFIALEFDNDDYDEDGILIV